MDEQNFFPDEHPDAGHSMLEAEEELSYDDYISLYHTTEFNPNLERDAQDAIRKSGQSTGRLTTATSSFAGSAASGFTGLAEFVAAGWQQLGETGADLIYGNPFGTTRTDPLSKEAGNIIWQIGEGMQISAESIGKNPKYSAEAWSGIIPGAAGSLVGMLASGNVAGRGLKAAATSAGMGNFVGRAGAAIRGKNSTKLSRWSGGLVRDTGWAGLGTAGAGMGMTFMEGWEDAHRTAVHRAMEEGRSELTQAELMTAWEAGAHASPAGLIEIFGAGGAGLRIMKHLDKLTRGAWSNRTLKFMDVVKGAAKGAGTEILQENAQNAWLNFGAAHMVGYDEGRGLFEGALESTIGGGAVGAFMGGLATAATRRTRLHREMRDLYDRATRLRRNGDDSTADQVEGEAQEIQKQLWKDVTGEDLDFDTPFPTGREEDTESGTVATDPNAPRRITYDLTDPNNPEVSEEVDDNVVVVEEEDITDIPRGSETDTSDLNQVIDKDSVKDQESADLGRKLGPMVARAIEAVGIDPSSVSVTFNRGTGGIKTNPKRRGQIMVDVDWVNKTSKKYGKRFDEYLDRAMDEEVRHLAHDEALRAEYKDGHSIYELDEGDPAWESGYRNFKKKRLRKIWDSMEEEDRELIRSIRRTQGAPETDEQLAEEFFRHTWQRLATGDITEEWVSKRGKLREIIESFIRYLKKVTSVGENAVIMNEIAAVEKALAKAEKPRAKSTGEEAETQEEADALDETELEEAGRGRRSPETEELDPASEEGNDQAQWEESERRRAEAEAAAEEQAAEDTAREEAEDPEALSERQRAAVEVKTSESSPEIESYLGEEFLPLALEEAVPAGKPGLAEYDLMQIFASDFDRNAKEGIWPRWEEGYAAESNLRVKSVQKALRYFQDGDFDKLLETFPNPANPKKKDAAFRWLWDGGRLGQRDSFEIALGREIGEEHRLTIKGTESLKDRLTEIRMEMIESSKKELAQLEAEEEAEKKLEKQLKESADQESKAYEKVGIKKTDKEIEESIDARRMTREQYRDEYLPLPPEEARKKNLPVLPYNTVPYRSRSMSGIRFEEADERDFNPDLDDLPLLTALRSIRLFQDGNWEALVPYPKDVEKNPQRFSGILDAGNHSYYAKPFQRATGFKLEWEYRTKKDRARLRKELQAHWEFLKENEPELWSDYEHVTPLMDYHKILQNPSDESTARNRTHLPGEPEKFITPEIEKILKFDPNFPHDYSGDQLGTYSVGDLIEKNDNSGGVYIIHTHGLSSEGAPAYGILPLDQDFHFDNLEFVPKVNSSYVRTPTQSETHAELQDRQNKEMKESRSEDDKAAKDRAKQPAKYEPTFRLTKAQKALLKRGPIQQIDIEKKGDGVWVEILMSRPVLMGEKGVAADLSAIGKGTVIAYWDSQINRVWEEDGSGSRGGGYYFVEIRDAIAVRLKKHENDPLSWKVEIKGVRLDTGEEVELLLRDNSDLTTPEVGDRSGIIDNRYNQWVLERDDMADPKSEAKNKAAEKEWDKSYNKSDYKSGQLGNFEVGDLVELEEENFHKAPPQKHYIKRYVIESKVPAKGKKGKLSYRLVELGLEDDTLQPEENFLPGSKGALEEMRNDKRWVVELTEGGYKMGDKTESEPAFHKRLIDHVIEKTTDESVIRQLTYYPVAAHAKWLLEPELQYGWDDESQSDLRLPSALKADTRDKHDYGVGNISAYQLYLREKPEADAEHLSYERNVREKERGDKVRDELLAKGELSGSQLGTFKIGDTVERQETEGQFAGRIEKFVITEFTQAEYEGDAYGELMVRVANINPDEYSNIVATYSEISADEEGFQITNPEESADSVDRRKGEIEWEYENKRRSYTQIKANVAKMRFGGIDRAVEGVANIEEGVELLPKNEDDTYSLTLKSGKFIYKLPAGDVREANLGVGRLPNPPKKGETSRVSTVKGKGKIKWIAEGKAWVSAEFTSTATFAKKLIKDAEAKKAQEAQEAEEAEEAEESWQRDRDRSDYDPLHWLGYANRHGVEWAKKYKDFLLEGLSTEEKERKYNQPFAVDIYIPPPAFEKLFSDDGFIRTGNWVDPIGYHGYQTDDRIMRLGGPIRIQTGYAEWMVEDIRRKFKGDKAMIDWANALDDVITRNTGKVDEKIIRENKETMSPEEVEVYDLIDDTTRAKILSQTSKVLPMDRDEAIGFVRHLLLLKRDDYLYMSKSERTAAIKTATDLGIVEFIRKEYGRQKDGKKGARAVAKEGGSLDKDTESGQKRVETIGAVEQTTGEDAAQKSDLIDITQQTLDELPKEHQEILRDALAHDGARNQNAAKGEKGTTSKDAAKRLKMPYRKYLAARKAADSAFKKLFAKKVGSKKPDEFDQAAYDPTASISPELPPIPYRAYETTYQGGKLELGKITDRLYHEDSPEMLAVFTGDANVDMRRDELYTSNNPVLALGQGQRKGVMFEFSSEGIEGTVNKKPAWDLAWEAGGAEFYHRHFNQGTWVDNLISVTISKEVQESPQFGRHLNNFAGFREARQGFGVNRKPWRRRNNSDGSITYVRPAEEWMGYNPDPEQFSQGALDPVNIWQYDQADEIRKDQRTGGRSAIQGEGISGMVETSVGGKKLPANGSDFSATARRYVSEISEAIETLEVGLKDWSGDSQEAVAQGVFSLLTDRTIALSGDNESGIPGPPDKLVENLSRLRRTIPLLQRETFYGKGTTGYASEGLERLGFGAEAEVFIDPEEQAVYKVVQIAEGGQLGKAGVTPTLEQGETGYNVSESSRGHTLLDWAKRIRIQNNHGGFVFTEIAGVMDNALVLKQRYIDGKLGKLPTPQKLQESGMVILPTPENNSWEVASSGEMMVHTHGGRAFIHSDYSSFGNVIQSRSDGEYYIIDATTRELSEKERSLPLVKESLDRSSMYSTLRDSMDQFAYDPVAAAFSPESESNRETTSSDLATQAQMNATRGNSKWSGGDFGTFGDDFRAWNWGRGDWGPLANRLRRWLSVVDTLESIGFKGLADRIYNYQIKVGEIQGRLMAPIRRWHVGKTQEQITAAYEEVGVYFEIREDFLSPYANIPSAKKIHDLIRVIEKEKQKQQSRSEEDRDYTQLNYMESQLQVAMKHLADKARERAEEHRKTMSPEANSLIEVLGKTADSTGEIADHLKIYVQDGGRWRRMRNLGRDHYPRAFAAQVMEVIQSPNVNMDLYTELKSALIRDGVVQTDEEAGDYMNSLIRFGEMAGGEFMANMERARGLRLPKEFYDTSVDNYIGFLIRFADRAAQIHAFGQTTDKTTDAFGAAIKSTPNLRTREYLQAVANEVYRRRPIQTGSDRLFERMISGTGLTYLSGFFTAVRDFVSGVMLSFEQYGSNSAAPTWRAMGEAIYALGRTAKMWRNKDWQTATPEITIEAEEMGAIRDDFIQAQLLDTRLDPQNELDRKLLKSGHYALYFKRSMDRLARGVTMGSSLNWLRASVKIYQLDPDSIDSKRRIAALKRLRFNEGEAAQLLSGLDGLKEEFARRSVAEKQYTYSLAQHPLFIGSKSPVMKLMFQFQRWTFQRGRDMIRNVIEPLIIGTKVGDQNIRDYWPLLRFAGAGLLFGELLKALMQLLTDREPRDATIEEIRNADTASDSFWLVFDRAVQDFVFTGATGFVGDYGKMVFNEIADRGQRWRDPFNPPLFSLTQDTISFWRDLHHKGYTGEALLQESVKFARGIPMANQLEGLVRGTARSVTGDTEGAWAARRDLFYTRSMARKYGEAKGLDIESRFRGNFSPDKYTAYKVKLKEALLVGDTKDAVEAKNALLEMGMSLRSIKSVVSSSQPVRVGFQTRDSVQDNFVNWARKMAPDQVHRIQRVQGRYNSTARRIGL